jgi:hypothetical protein
MTSTEEHLSIEGELREQVRQLLEETTELKSTIQRQQEEIQRLNKLLGLDGVPRRKHRRSTSSSSRSTRQAMSMTLPGPLEGPRRPGSELLTSLTSSVKSLSAGSRSRTLSYGDSVRVHWQH